MAKKMKVWVGDVSKSRFSVAHVVYGEAQPMQSRAGCLVDFGGDHHERVFTESEVRALAKRRFVSGLPVGVAAWSAIECPDRMLVAGDGMCAPFAR